MHWVFDYPWGPTGTWLAVVAIVTVLAASFALVWRELVPVGPGSVLVVLLRLAAFGILVFLLLQPSVILKKSEEIKPHTAILVDTSGSMAMKDVGRSESRLKLATKALELSHLIDDLGQKSRLSVFEFSTGLSRIKKDGIDKLEKPTGTGTSLGLAIAQLADELKGEDLAGVVLLSDGRDNTGIDPEKAAGELDAPVFTIGFGRPKPKVEKVKEKDLAIVNVSHDKRVVVGHTTDVTVTVMSKGFGARTVPVELLLDEQLVTRSSVALSPDRPERGVTVKITPSAPGQFVFTVRVPVDPEEGNKANNEKPVPMYVADPVARVLYVEARPRWEFKFLSRVLSAYKNIEHTSLVRLSPQKKIVQGTKPADAARIATMTPLQLQRLKAIIIGDVPRNFFCKNQLATIATLVEQGAAVMLLAGPESFGHKGFGGTPLERVLPCDLLRRMAYMERPFRIRLTPEGKAHPAFQGDRFDWRRAPAIQSLVRIGTLRPGATALMETTQGKLPVVVAHRYGRGKACIVCTDSTWHWKLGMARGKIRKDLHTIFWRQMITWLMPEQREEKERRAVQLVADKLQYELNEQVNLTVTALDNEGKTARDAKVVVHIYAPDGKVIERRAAFGKLPGAGDAQAEGFAASFKTYVGGKYKVVATAQADGSDLGRDHVSFVVGDTSIEMTETDPDRELLRKIAHKSRGRYHTPSDAAKIADEIVIKTKKNTWTEKKEVWDRWWVFLTFLGLVTAEWVVRRARQLE